MHVMHDVACCFAIFFMKDSVDAFIVYYSRLLLAKLFFFRIRFSRHLIGNLLACFAASFLTSFAASFLTIAKYS